MGELCPGSAELPDGADPGMTVAEVLQGAEADLVAGADDQTLVAWAELIDFINSSGPPDHPDCQEAPRRGRGRV